MGFPKAAFSMYADRCKQKNGKGSLRPPLPDA